MVCASQFRELNTACFFCRFGRCSFGMSDHPSCRSHCSACASCALKPSAEVANLPDFRPETAAACNSVRLSVAVAADGSLVVNGGSVDLAGLKAAAAKKNDACQYVAAAVNLSVARGVPDKRAEEIRDALAGGIEKISALIKS